LWNWWGWYSVCRIETGKPRMNTDLAYQALLDLWFHPAIRDLWYNSTEEFDSQLRNDYSIMYQSAKNNELEHWQNTPLGSLALVILLDQIPLNIFRGQPESFATESLAIHVAGKAIGQGFDQELDNEQKTFLYMPFMHSEQIDDQETAVALFEQAGLSFNLEYAYHHRDIVSQFGRFPHRNIILGRENTAAETDYLASDKAFLG